MGNAAPRLRDDLDIRRQDTREGTFYVVKDPARRTYFRLREPEYDIARRLDGTTSLDTLGAQLAVLYGDALEPETLEGFVQQLRQRGLLAAEDGSRPKVVKPGLFRGNVVWLRVKAVDPDALFNWLHPRIGFFFTPAFVTLAATVILTGLAIVLSNGAQLGPDLRRLWGAHGLFLIWTAIFFVTVLHEFAHGLTCKHFGGEVHELGFLLIYGGPAFYCNVSDSWLFPEKSRRLWVMAAGGFFELFVWGLAVIVWRLAEPATWLGSGALVIVVTSGVRQFFNLNPLIKLDGYYLLSDWLEMPNLRVRAFGYVGRQLKRLFGYPRPADDPTPRERWIYATYGLVAAVFSYWLLSRFALWGAGTLIRHYQGWGFVVFAAVANVAVGNPLKRLIPRGPARWAALPLRAKQLIVLAAGVAVLAVVRLDLTASGQLKILPSQNADLRADVEGRIAQVFVREGQTVAAGDTIIRLAADEDQARLRMAEADIAERQARLRLLRAGARPEERDMARLAAEKATERLGYATGALERLEALARSQAASRSELEQAQESVAVLTKERDEARARLQVLQAGTRPEEVAAAEQQLAHAQADRQRLEDRLAKLIITTPHGGVVTTPKVEEKTGEYVKPGDLIAEVYALRTVMAEIAVPEREIGDVRVGQRGALRLRAYPERAFEGRVISIAPRVTVEPQTYGEPIVRVTIEIPNDSGLIKPEMSGFARIYAGKRPALDVLTRRVRRFVRVEFWSWW